MIAAQGCAVAPERVEVKDADVQDAARNAASAYTMPIDLFGRPEQGWAIYAPRISQTVASDARADTPSFAAALARWRRTHGLGGRGEVDAPVLQAMKREWQSQRPFLALRAQGRCPDPPPPGQLAAASLQDSVALAPVLGRPAALAAYRRMVKAARRAQPSLRARPDILKVFSAFRSPGRDAARCAQDGNCHGVVRAACSAHRTGLAFDLVLDTAPGFTVDSSADANRLAMARGLAYRWLLANAGRFGFVNYAFEPWHWEWTGERP